MPSDPFDKTEKRRRLFVVALWVGMIVYVYFITGTSAEGLYRCPFNAMTGYDCPGCGMTRATTHVFHGRFGEALAYHPFGLPFAVGFSLLAWFRGAELLRGRPIDLPFRDLVARHEKRLWLALLIIAAGFGLGRLALEIAGILTPL